MENMYLAICDDDADILGAVSGAIVSAFRKHGISAQVELFRRAGDLEREMRTKDFEPVSYTHLTLPTKRT